MDWLVADWVKIMINIVLAFVDENGDSYYQPLSVPVGTTIRGAVMMSGWLTQPQFAWLSDWLAMTEDDATPIHKAWHLGVFSQKKPLGYVVQAGDRVEIYRALRLDPMHTRQSKVAIDKKSHAKAVQAKNIARLAKRGERKKAGD